MPRSVRAKAREIERVNAKLEHELQRAPTDQEMSEKLGVTIDEFQETCADLELVGGRPRRAVDRLGRVRRPGVAARHDPGPAGADPAQEMDATEMKDHLADAIARLPEREKLVVALYYYENLTFREIGEVLGVTESRVSQLHTKAVLRLKSRLQGDPSPKRSGGGQTPSGPLRPRLGRSAARAAPAGSGGRVGPVRHWRVPGLDDLAGSPRSLSRGGGSWGSRSWLRLLVFPRGRARLPAAGPGPGCGLPEGQPLRGGCTS